MIAIPNKALTRAELIRGNSSKPNCDTGILVTYSTAIALKIKTQLRETSKIVPEGLINFSVDTFTIKLRQII